MEPQSGDERRIKPQQSLRTYTVESREPNARTTRARYSSGLKIARTIAPDASAVTCVTMFTATTSSPALSNPL